MSHLAPQVGLEPTTFRLTAERSAIELLRIILFFGCPLVFLHLFGYSVTEKTIFIVFSAPSSFESGDVLLSRAVPSQVPSACGGLTSVFGMGTGGSLQLLSPETLFGCQSGFVLSLSFPRFALRLTAPSKLHRFDL